MADNENKQNEKYSIQNLLALATLIGIVTTVLFNGFKWFWASNVSKFYGLPTELFLDDFGALGSIYEFLYIIAATSLLFFFYFFPFYYKKSLNIKKENKIYSCVFSFLLSLGVAVVVLFELIFSFSIFYKYISDMDFCLAVVTAIIVFIVMMCIFYSIYSKTDEEFSRRKIANKIYLIGVFVLVVPFIFLAVTKLSKPPSERTDFEITSVREIEDGKNLAIVAYKNQKAVLMSFDMEERNVISLHKGQYWIEDVSGKKMEYKFFSGTKCEYKKAE